MERCRKIIRPAEKLSDFVLKNSLSHYLEMMGKLLKDSSFFFEKIENKILCREHGEIRALNSDYSLEQLILKYQILTMVIFDILEETSFVNPGPKNTIIYLIHQSMSSAVNEFCTIQTDKLEQEKRLSDRFIAGLSHDLRNPIGAAKMVVSLIRTKNAEVLTRLDYWLSRVENNLDRSLEMISDLLDIKVNEARRNSN